MVLPRRLYVESLDHGSNSLVVRLTFSTEKLEPNFHIDHCKDETEAADNDTSDIDPGWRLDAPVVGEESSLSLGLVRGSGASGRRVQHHISRGVGGRMEKSNTVLFTQEYMAQGGKGRHGACVVHDCDELSIVRGVVAFDEGLELGTKVHTSWLNMVQKQLVESIPLITRTGVELRMTIDRPW
ncbi:hypothetical protein LIER_01297 [Lithospermum erythrorhizon]|uniref:Uncharacterized protein n=1 Tax=Lithospermum erythrorhizon TaxID=34254 RepID=A0AAV3NLW6_LITER